MKTQLTSTIAILAMAVSANAAIVLPLAGSITVEAEAFDSQVGTTTITEATYPSGGQYVDQFQNTGTDYIQFDFTGAAPNPSQQFEITLYYRYNLTAQTTAVVSELVPGPAAQSLASVALPTLTGWQNNPFTTITSAPFTFSSTATALRFTGIDTGGSQHATLKGAYHLDRFTLTAIPEPSAALLGAIGFLALLRRRR